LIEANHHTVETVVADQYIGPGPEDPYRYMLTRRANDESGETVRVTRAIHISRPTAQLEPGQAAQRGVSL
jgi:hypothetical protein